MAEKIQVCPICGGEKLIYHTNGDVICRYCDTIFGYGSEKLSTEDIFNINEKCVVEIKNSISNEVIYGTGVVVSEKGYILTSAHLIGNAVKTQGLCDNIVMRNRKSRQIYGLRVICIDYSLDLALLCNKWYRGNKPLVFSNNKSSIGERICVIGNGKGEGLCMVDGILSNDDIDISGRHLSVISAPITGGYSGGPIFNMRGEAIGIAIAGRKDASSINYAVPSYFINQFLSSIDLHESPDKYLENDNAIISSINKEFTDGQRLPPDIREHPINNMVTGIMNDEVAETRLDEDGNLVYTDNNGFEYKETDGVLTLTGYYGNGGKITIPGYFNGMQVKTIGTLTITRRKSITEIVIDEGVEVISDWAFSIMYVEAVHIPSTMREMGVENNPFFQTYTKKFIVADSNPFFTTDETGMFLLSKDKKELKAFAIGNTEPCKIPDGIKTIGLRAFCFSKITDVDIPDSVTDIATAAFLDSRELKSIYLPKNVKSIGDCCFTGTWKLEKAVVEEGSLYFRSEDNIVYDTDNNIVFAAQSQTSANYTVPLCNAILCGAFGDNTNLVNVVIPDGVVEIRSESFIFCDNHRTIVIPSSVKSMLENIFDHSMNRHRNLTIYGFKDSTAEEYAAHYAYAFCEIEVRDDEVVIVRASSNNQSVIHILSEINGKKVVLNNNALNDLLNTTVFGCSESNAKTIADSKGLRFIEQN